MTRLSETKRELFEKYARGKVLSSQVAAPATKRPPGEQAPLSVVQEQVWRRALSNQGVPSLYNESITIQRTGELDVAALERSFTEIIRRHEAWRTTFDTIDGQPIQVIHPPPSRVAVPFLDLRKIPESSREAEALRLATEDARRPFDLKQGPLVRPLLVTLDERTHRLFLTMHQSIVDGVSVYQILPSELTVLYGAFSTAKPSPLRDLQLQYADLAYWERQLLQGQALTDQLTYWRKRLACELPPLQWPSPRRRSGVRSFAGRIRAFTLSKSLGEELKEMSQREGVTLFITLLAGFTLILSQYADRQDVAVTTLAPAGRKLMEAQQLLGYFLNPVALRIDLSGKLTIRELLRQAREVVLEALCHDDVPFEYLIQELKPKPDLACHSLSEMVITLAPPLPELPSGWSQRPMDVDSGWARWDLYLELSSRPTGVMGRAQYSTEMFTPATISQVLQDFVAVLEYLAANAEQRISDVPHFAHKLVEREPHQLPECKD